MLKIKIMKNHKIRIQKEISIETAVDIDEEFDISQADILEALKHSEDLDDILDSCGFISVSKFGFAQGSILDAMKIELIGDILKKTTLDQLERFRNSL